jgi:hypothetical protein
MPRGVSAAKYTNPIQRHKVVVATHLQSRARFGRFAGANKYRYGLDWVWIRLEFLQPRCLSWYYQYILAVEVSSKPPFRRPQRPLPAVAKALQRPPGLSRPL